MSKKEEKKKNKKKEQQALLHPEEREAKAAKKLEKQEERIRKSTKPDAPYWRRFMGYMLDFYFGAMFTFAPVCAFAQKLTGDMTHINFEDFASPYNYIAGILAILFAIFFYFITPAFIWRGQTPGKRMCSTKIVNTDGSDVSILTLLIRQLVGIILVEGVLYSVSGSLRTLLDMALGTELSKPLMYIAIAISLVSILIYIFKPSHRMLHDYIAGTKVIYVPKEIIKDNCDH